METTGTQSRKSDPETAMALAMAAIEQIETALHLFQLATRLDRGEPANPDIPPTAPPQGSYLAQREMFLAIGHLNLSTQKAKRAIAGWKQNAEARYQDDPGTG